MSDTQADIDNLLMQARHVRERNNELWMILVGMAVKDPDAKGILREIYKNDQRIAGIIMELVRED